LFRSALLVSNNCGQEPVGQQAGVDGLLMVGELLIQLLP
jgi:hypothetical protein